MAYPLPRFFILSLLCVAALPGSSAFALGSDSYMLELGAGNDQTYLARAGVRRNWDWNTPLGKHLVAAGYWELGLANWRGHGPGAKDLWDLGLTPVLRVYPTIDLGPVMYLEGAIGVHLLSDNRINSARHLGGNFQFGDIIGLGIVFGNRAQYELGYRLEHVSNADLETPNQGINVNQIHLTQAF
jgi:lipid A 3-O-deacylase